MFPWKHRNGKGQPVERKISSGHTCRCGVDERSGACTLADVEPGQKVQICCLSGESRLIRRLSEMGFIPGTVIEVLRRAPFLDPIEFEIRGYLVSLRRAEAECIRVKAGKPAASLLTTDSVSS